MGSSAKIIEHLVKLVKTYAYMRRPPAKLQAGCGLTPDLAALRSYIGNGFVAVATLWCRPAVTDGIRLPEHGKMVSDFRRMEEIAPDSFCQIWSCLTHVPQQRRLIRSLPGSSSRLHTPPFVVNKRMGVRSSHSFVHMPPTTVIPCASLHGAQTEISRANREKTVDVDACCALTAHTFSSWLVSSKL